MGAMPPLPAAAAGEAGSSAAWEMVLSNFKEPFPSGLMGAMKVE